MCLLVEMIFILCLCHVMLGAGVQTLTIDTQLGTSIEDCFERISIGEQIPSSAIYRNVSEVTTRECETICKQDKQCQSYDYGVGAKGNATCDLSMVDEKEIKEKTMLIRHPDYDIYVRRRNCEQSPPTPMQVLSDEPSDGPLHKPVFRPDNDDRRPLDDDLKPFESFRPEYKPIPPYRPNREPHNPNRDPYRPDDYTNSKPIHDFPPSYGDHKPVHIPYTPYKPDPYDVFHFRPSHDRPQRPPNPALWRPDPYHPPQPDDDIPDLYGFTPKPRPPLPIQPYVPTEKPVYHYFIRPPKKPYQTQMQRPDSYGEQPVNNYNIRPETGYTQESIPNRPYDYPSRPYNKPIYNYNSQYAAGYGQNQEPIHVEIIDPPRPYKPNKPERPYGYHTSQSYGGFDQEHQEYSQSQSNGYGQNQSNYGQRPQNDHAVSPHKPQSYGGFSGEHQIYSQSQSNGYEDQRPQYGEVQRPSHGYHQKPQEIPNDNYGSGPSYHNRPNYDMTEKPVFEGYHRPQTYPFDLTHRPDHYYPYGVKPIPEHLPSNTLEYNRPNDQRPSYGGEDDYLDDSGGYGGYRNNHRPNQNQHRPAVDKIDNSYQRKPAYGNNKDPSYGHESNDGNKPTQGYGKDPSSNHNNQASSGYEKEPNTGYGDKPSSAYGHQKPSYDKEPSSSYGNQPSPSYTPATSTEYNNPTPSYGGQDYNKPEQSYGGSAYDKPTPSYGGSAHDKPKPSYGGSAYDKPTPSYGGSEYDKPTSSYGGQEYNKPKPSYGGSAYDKPTASYGSSAYDNPRPGYGSETEHQNSYTTPPANHSGGYHRPDIKPVYEYSPYGDRPEEPSYIYGPNGEVVTSKPVAVSGYGRRPTLMDRKHFTYEACFRRVLAGMRALRSFVRRVLPCEALRDCTGACATETRFHCESFNYRLDRTFRGKGLCELMTRPIEAFNIRRDFVEDKDYDFYEIDRNSLEPNCPETLGGPGLLHSGFLSSKPNRLPDETWTRDSWHSKHHYDLDTRFYDDRRNDDRFYTTSSRRKYNDRDRFIPYQIGIPAIARSDQEDLDKWGKYGGVYGGSNTYYKDRNDYHKSINYWRINNDIDLPRDFGVKPIEKTKFDPLSFAKSHFGVYDKYGYGYGPWKRGKWNTSGNSNVGFDSSHYAGESYYKPFKPSQFYGPVDRDDRGVNDDTQDCSSRRKPGMSLGSGAIRRSLHAKNVLECEAACFDETEFKCVSYSFRYSSPRNSDNCFLSERSYRGLPLSVDTESDVYAMPENVGCSGVNRKPWVETECFWHVRSGATPGAAARARLTVAGLGACEAECIRAVDFFCRGFSFRFDAPTIGDDLQNCILTSSPPTSLLAGQLRPHPGHELYARGNYGRGCEPALYDVTHSARECYLQHDKAARLLPSAIKGRAHVADERACGHACTTAPFQCYSFSYNNKPPPHSDNCFLSSVRLFDLQLSVDYEHSNDDWLFAYDLFNNDCLHRKEAETGSEHSHELPRPLPPSSGDHGTGPPAIYIPTAPAEPPYISSSGPPSAPPVYKPPPPVGPDSKPGYLPEARPEFSSGGFKPGYPPPEPPYFSSPSIPTGPSGPSKPDYLPTGPGYLPDRPAPDHRPGYLPERPDPGHRPGYSPEPGFKPGYLPERPVPEYRPDRPRPGHANDRGDVEPLAVSWRHYTVSGFPCRKGSFCAQNTVAGHWACEPEGGEIGSWDYCCAPTHRCGYSEGFSKPWCYVGPNNDQWRPCSEKYYPYHQHGVPHPSQEITGPPRPWGQPTQAYLHSRSQKHEYLSEGDRKYWDDLYKNGPSAYYDKYGDPLPGYTRVPNQSRSHASYKHYYSEPASGRWMPVGGSQPPGLGAPRYWPVAYLHKGPPPNMTYFRYNETERYTTTTERYTPLIKVDNRDNISSKNQPIPDYKRVDENRPIKPDIVPQRENDRPNTNNNNNVNTNNRGEKNRNISNTDKDIFSLKVDNLKTTSTTTTSTTTQKAEQQDTDKSEDSKEVPNNSSEIEAIKPENFKSTKDAEELKGIDGKLEDFSKSIEVLDISDAEKIDKSADLKTLEAEEEKQIEAIGRLLAHRRGGKLVIEKRSQQDLRSKGIAVDNAAEGFGNLNFEFPSVERRGKIQKVTKEEIEKERNQDRSLEVSETTFVRPPRVLSTTDNIRRAVINGKVFYDATIREQRDIFANTSKIINKPSASTTVSNFAKKGRKVNPVRRVRRIYRRKYNPGEVRRRLLEKEKNSIKPDNMTLISTA